MVRVLLQRVRQEQDDGLALGLPELVGESRELHDLAVLADLELTRVDRSIVDVTELAPLRVVVARLLLLLRANDRALDLLAAVSGADQQHVDRGLATTDELRREGPVDDLSSHREVGVVTARTRRTVAGRNLLLRNRGRQPLVLARNLGDRLGDLLLPAVPDLGLRSVKLLASLDGDLLLLGLGLCTLGRLLQASEELLETLEALLSFLVLRIVDRREVLCLLVLRRTAATERSDRERDQTGTGHQSDMLDGHEPLLGSPTMWVTEAKCMGPPHITQPKVYLDV